MTRLGSLDVVQLLKKIPDTRPARHVVLTTNDRKESSISNIDRYSISTEPHGDEGGQDFVLRITGMWKTGNGVVFTCLCLREMLLSIISEINVAGQTETK